MKRIIPATLLLLLSISATCQDFEYARHMVDTLASPTFWGRGYTKEGMHKAAAFLAAEFKTIGLKPLHGDSYFQRFQYPVNTFPGKMELTLNATKLIPGVDYIVSEESRGAKCKGEVIKKDSVTFIDRENRIIFEFKDKLTMSVAPEVREYTLVKVDRKRFKQDVYVHAINIENKLVRAFNADNICGIVKGTEVPDSFLVITAHYDHLGGLGADTYFPGANDNASGISLLLNLARYYAQHPMRHSLVFILFAGEEAGILGSKHFTENPLIELNKIRFLLNTDLAGTGEDGITVINSTVYPTEFELMKKINDEKQFLKALNQRGKAANSDHYWFTEKGVPAFFFFTQGGIQAYHDVFDKAETLPLNKHEDLIKLVTAFYGVLDK